MPMCMTYKRVSPYNIQMLRKMKISPKKMKGKQRNNLAGKLKKRIILYENILLEI
jgi:hypothetical protein